MTRTRRYESWQQVKERAMRRAKRLRDELIEELGGACVECGATERLEFDHLEPRTWRADEKNLWVRMKIYRREAAEGKLQLLCKSCNCRKGSPGRLPLLGDDGNPLDDFPDQPSLQEEPQSEFEEGSV